MKKSILATILILTVVFSYGQSTQDRELSNPERLIINTWICSDAKYDTSDKKQYENVKKAFRGKEIKMDNSALLVASKGIDVLVFKEKGILIESDRYSKNTRKEYKISPCGDKLLSYRADGAFSKMDTSQVLKITSDTLILYSGIVRKTFTAFK